MSLAMLTSECVRHSMLWKLHVVDQPQGQLLMLPDASPSKRETHLRGCQPRSWKRTSMLPVRQVSVVDQAENVSRGVRTPRDDAHAALLAPPPSPQAVAAARR